VIFDAQRKSSRISQSFNNFQLVIFLESKNLETALLSEEFFIDGVGQVRKV
jgi:hypothetical protein